ncbi:MAG: uracil-DNA glycosylase [Acidobacteriota bacterium]
MKGFVLPPPWQAAVGAELDKPYFHELAAFVESERRTATVFPGETDVANAFLLTPFDRVKVVLLGQDPYHGEGQAHGLCFSVKAPAAIPPSLRNVFRELASDLDHQVPTHGDLTSWALQGVLLLNAVLTVRAHEPGSHRGRGWETFTDAVLAALDARGTPAVFCLWGAWAKKKAPLIDTARHAVIASAHPSPLSAKAFLGSRPFSKIDAALTAMGHAPIDWRVR